MQLAVWSDDLAVNIHAFDLAHQKLFQILNELNIARQQGRGHRVTVATLQALASYAEQHFSDEENVLYRFNYPGLAEQVKMHRNFVKRVRELEEIAKPPMRISTKLSLFLRDWLVHHIMVVDRAYVPFLSERGVR